MLNQHPKLEQKPVYEHDCSNCKYLGSIEFHSGEHVFPRPPEYLGIYDLYFCPADLLGPTIIARYSSDGPDYYSGLVFGQTGAMAPLVAAYAMAVKEGLV